MGYHNHRSWEAARLPPAEIGEDALWLRKRQRDEGKEMAGSPSFLSSPGGGNTGTEKSWKTHLSWKAVPVCGSHRCKSHTPAYRGEGGTGNPSLSRLHEVRRVYIRLQDSAVRCWPQDKTVICGHVHTVC